MAIVNPKKITSIDPGKAHWIVEEHCKELDFNVSFSTNSLFEYLRDFSEGLPNKALSEKDDQLIYTWKDAGIISPDTVKKKNRDVFRYSHDQVKRATMACYLWSEENIAPSEIAGAVMFWADPVIQEIKEVSLILREWERAFTWLSSRLLGVSMALAVNEDGPPRDSTVICRRIPQDELENPGRYRLSYLKPGEMPEIVKGVVIGYSAKRYEAEIFARITGYKDLLQRMFSRDYFRIQIDGLDSTESAYEMALGFADDLSDPRTVEFIRQLGLEGLSYRVPLHDRILLYDILRYLLDQVIYLPSLLIGNDSRFRLPLESDHFVAMSTAIVAADPSWKGCAFFVKENEILRIRSFSPNYTFRGSAMVPYDPQNNLLSWVYASEDHVVIEDLKDFDPRVKQIRRFLGPNPFAIVPALTSQGVQGVVLVTADKKIETRRAYFSPRKIALLFVLAGVLGEANMRQKLADVGHFLSEIPAIQESYNDEVALRLTLRDLLNQYMIEQRGTVDEEERVLNESVVLFSIRVDTDAEDSIQRWYDNQICRRLTHFLRSKVRSSRITAPEENVQLFKVNPGRLVALVKSYYRTPQFPIHRIELQNHIREFSDAHDSIDANLWSVQFDYIVLKRLLGDQNAGELSSVDSQVQAIMGHLHRALQNARLLSEADRHLREGHFDEALSSFTLALGRRSINESDDAYVLRHLSDVYAGLHEFELSLDCAKQAIRADREMKLPGYAGSYLRLASALCGLGNHREALNAYETVFQMSQDSRYHLAYAKFLIQYGWDGDDHIRKALEILGDLLRREEDAKQMSWLAYLQAKAFNKLSDDGFQVRNSLGMAMRYDKDNQYAQWEIETANIQAEREN